MLLNQFLLLSAFLFCTGIYGVLTRKHTVLVLMSIELMLAAVNINLVAFGAFHNSPLDPGRVEGERPLDADTVGDAPDGEAGPRTLTALPDDHALEDLDALLLTLDDLHVHAHGVARGEVSPVALEHPRLDDGDRVGPHWSVS